MTRKFFHLLVFLLLSTVLSVSCTSDETTGTNEANDTNPIPLEALVMENVSYGSNDQQVYDIYLPPGRTVEKTKVLVLVHGGGWTGGDKEDMDIFVELIQQNLPNYAIVNLNYVLATGETPAFPNQFLDIGTVITKITTEKELLQVLPEFGLIGTSAGAHLSLQYDYVYDTSDVVKMVCDIVGPTDLTDPFYSEDPNYPLLLSALVDESAYPPGTDYAEAISPALQVSRDSSPSILFYGNEDPLVPLSNGETLEQALSEAMVTHSYTVYEGGHGDDWSQASILDLEEQLINFVQTHLPIQ